MNVLFAGKRGIWRASIELSQMVSGLLSCLQHYNSFGNSYLVNRRGRLGRITLVFLRGKEITRVIRLMVGGIELFGGKRWNNSSFILLAFFFQVLCSFSFFWIWWLNFRMTGWLAGYWVRWAVNIRPKLLRRREMPHCKHTTKFSFRILTGIWATIDYSIWIKDAFTTWRHSST